VASLVKLAVIGGGWAGLAAAIEGVQRGWAVTLFEMAPQLGGRARGVHSGGAELDNGQHILIGAYTETLRLMRTVGVDTEAALLRTPLCLTTPDGRGLRLPPGPPTFAFLRGVLARRGWSLGDRLALLAVAARWSLHGFRCDAGLSVAALTAGLPQPVREALIDPLCVAAMNTPADEASARVFLRVLRDALFSGSGSADLLLPRASLSELLPRPAAVWLERAGARLRLAHRVETLAAADASWAVDGEPFARVVLAASATEAARLVRPIALDWAAAASGLRYEPIITLYLRSAGTRLPEPMLVLASGDDAPAQFVFDRGQLVSGSEPGLLAFVVSGAQTWVDRGQEATLQATQRQATTALAAHLRGPLQSLAVLSERRATFRCTPGLVRPPRAIAPGLHAAGDSIDGPYPATLEGAVRSGLEAVRAWA
jgi:squalene-associated FAD-dependent desaturase